jgi:hypothetical protein|nr:DUF4301 family protein [bacterium]
MADLAPFDAGDLAQLKDAGIGLEEARRQRALLASPPAPLLLERPCVVGDGIRRLDAREEADYEARGAALLTRQRVAKFVPASGAATRMFKDLLAALSGDAAFPPPAAATVLESAQSFAFFEPWCLALEAADGKAFAMVLAKGRWREALQALLKRPGLDYASLPKAFLLFHRHAGRARTALEEHWREAAALGLKRLHFTLSPEHDEEFQALTKALRGLGSQDLPADLDLSRSFQDPSTDTLAGDGAGGLFRTPEGRLVLRPGGHGALIHNLQALAQGTDVALLRNIDNIAHPRLWPRALRAKRILLGLLDEATQGSFEAPVRVVGVVPNTGEAGGGPFWVRGLPQAQIVESAQVSGDPAQKGIFASSTHFNPVDMACRLTDAQGKPFDLARFMDPGAVFLSSKSHLGRPLTALERPGLWNGAMARWKTLFVEMPLETFNPVKTVADLLKPAHQELP